jgi:hypothetical protein
MKLGCALDQFEDAIEAIHASLATMRRAQPSVARYVGGILEFDRLPSGDAACELQQNVIYATLARLVRRQSDFMFVRRNEPCMKT